MSQPLPPSIIVWSGGWQRTFPPGRDVVIGRDVRADIRLPQSLVSGSHMILRCVDGQWVAIDNESLNGIYVGYDRVPSVEIRSGASIHIGNPDGPQLTFELGAVPPPDDPPPNGIRQDAERKTVVVSRAAAVMRTRWRGAPEAAPPGTTTIGRSRDNDIVVPDVLVSHHHATLVPTAQGIQIHDAGSMNGTFVNGQRVKDAVLRDNDVVTVGNADFVLSDGVLVRRTELADKADGLEVHGVSLVIDGNRTLLDHISISARPGTLTAVIGPSGSGKSTLAKVIVGAARPDGGTVSFEGHNLHAEYASLRSRIGMVPQDDVVHRQLTVSQALGFAAELRMPPDTTKQYRQHVIAQVLEELDMTPHAQTRVDKLSGGQRKRVSVAMELLTGPSLLVLDEPTSGLDPLLDRQVMTMLRQLADAGRVIVVITHALTYLHVCDQVLMLGPGGRTAFCGPPSEIGPAMGTTNWAEIFTDVGADPVAAQRRYLERAERSAPLAVQAPPEIPADLGQPVHTSLWRQFSTIARRQLRLIVADRGYFVFLALLPFIMSLLPLAAGGDTGFGKAAPDSPTRNEPAQLVVLMNLGAVFMGTALTVRELVGERAIFRREQAVGLSASAYLLAKICVFGAAAVIQSALLVLIVTAGKGAPLGAVVLGSPTLELFVDMAATCVVSAILGLAVSAVAKTSNQVLPLTVTILAAQLVLGGGFIPVTGRPGVDALSWLAPSRWGLAATASTADLINTVAGAPDDSHWRHTPSAWLFDMVMLGVLAVLYAGFVRWRIRLSAAAK